MEEEKKFKALVRLTGKEVTVTPVQDPAAWAIASLILALLQNVWQGTALECFVRQLDKQGKTRFDHYPDHISNGGWAFYILKMLAALIAIATMVAGWII